MFTESTFRASAAPNDTEIIHVSTPDENSDETSDEKSVRMILSGKMSLYDFPVKIDVN